MSDRGPIGRDHHPQKYRLYSAQQGRCLACNRKQRYAYLTRHHVILHACGGSDDDGNICLLCADCHAKCHHYNRRIQHDALKPILIAFGFGPEVRDEFYAMYRNYGVFGPRHQTILRREKELELARWADDGGSVVAA